MLNTADLVRRARNLLKGGRPIPAIINHFVAEGVGENSAWAVVEEASFENLQESVKSAFALLKKGESPTEAKRTLMHRGYSWTEAEMISDAAQKLASEEAL
ncbi:hypothetical protein A2V54_00575 [candidate division WWE3 bacterium RBG_19FT_COMBO_53_11]|uniref:Regulatory protein RecX n=1 Tax=candidate division WWE3 bacterium RBG_19FT_COMBO_53_11 TaxID=1802613 RepID=A0A1F4UIE2_UNCKA|nr:MAG: hypothetical protein A2155_02080 [candidate division WWE3 bacterium RBG_16_52_45]OGC44642.1 MAG: hypothetical protein A2V54_00575 [candidate division WWE3 bacterium RBG_19FT_COMBO_53_11]